MAKEACGSCEVRLEGPASFCPSCGQPTHYANDAERLDWDLRQWRAHVDRSVAAGVVPNGRSNARMSGVQTATTTAVATRPHPETERLVEAPKLAPARVETPKLAPARVETPKPLKVKRERRSPRIHVPHPRLPRLRRAPSEPERTVEIDRDHEFAYRACATCRATDWIVRTTRNDDETWNYWCVRCSRSFKTEIKISQALKPFLSAVIVIGGLLAASFLMLR